MATDPICGMTVDESSPLRAERDGQTFYFCSEHCRKKFVEHVRPVASARPSPVSAGSEPRRDHEQIRRRFNEPSGTRSFAARPRGCACTNPHLLPNTSARCVREWSRISRAIVRNAAWRWSVIRLGSRPRRAKTIYTCPMHPEVQQDHPGDCPKCGMPLEPMTVDSEHGRGRKRRTARHDQAILDWCRAHVAGVCPGDGSPGSGTGRTVLGK